MPPSIFVNKFYRFIIVSIRLVSINEIEIDQVTIVNKTGGMDEIYKVRELKFIMIKFNGFNIESHKFFIPLCYKNK